MGIRSFKKFPIFGSSLLDLRRVYRKFGCARSAIGCELSLLLCRQALRFRNDSGRPLLDEELRMRDVSLRDAIVPGEVIFVPQRPQEAQQQRATRDQVAETPPE